MSVNVYPRLAIQRPYSRWL